MSKERLFVNALTFSRLPLIFAWMAIAIVAEFQNSVALAWTAGLCMFLSGVSDFFDGKLARKWQVVSQLGKMADPLMDKVFYLCAFPTLIWQISSQAESPRHALMMLAFTVLYLLRDTWVTFLRSVGSVYGADVSAMWIGKVRTALSFPGAGWVYAYLALHHSVSVRYWDAWLYSCFVVEGLLMVLTVYSLFTYTASYWKYLKKALAKN